MKALTVQQPFANLIASGLKTLEVRWWSTSYRGPLLITSSKSPNIPPAGMVIARVNMVACRPMTQADAARAHAPFQREAFVFVFQDAVKLKPVSVKGRLSIFDLEINPARLVEVGRGKKAGRITNF